MATTQTAETRIMQDIGKMATLLAAPKPKTETLITAQQQRWAIRASFEGR